MGNSKTIVCPNCGAVSSNLDNCEYCGSILVKVASIFHEEGKDVTKELEKLGIGTSVYVNPAIMESIEKNTNRCKRFNTTVECFFPLHYRIEVEDWRYRIEDRWLDNISIIFHPNSAPILKIKYFMGDSIENEIFKRFESLRISRLFKITQEGNSMICSSQMDDDVKTTAQIIASIIKSPFNFIDNAIYTSEFVTLNGTIYRIVTETQKRHSEESLKLYYKEFAKQQEPKRFRGRLSEIANIKHFITMFWLKYYQRYHYTKIECRYWIDENSTEEDIKKIVESTSLQDAIPPAIEKVINEIIEEETQEAENAKNTTKGCVTVIGVIILVIILCASC